MAYAAPGHQRKRSQDRRIGRYRDGGRCHDVTDLPVEHIGTVRRKPIDDVTFRKNAGNDIAVDNTPDRSFSDLMM